MNVRSARNRSTRSSRNPASSRTRIVPSHVQAHLTEEAESLVRGLQEVWGAAVAKAWKRVEEKSWTEVEGERAAVSQMRAAEQTTVMVVGLERGESSGTETEESSGEDKVGTATQKSSRRQVVTSCQNTAEVMIVRPATKGKGPAEAVGATRVSLTALGQTSASDNVLGSFFVSAVCTYFHIMLPLEHDIN